MLVTSQLEKRAGLIQAVRQFFIGQGYLEVDTPVRLPACAPEAHIEPEPAADWFLQTSPELCMKRLLAYGNEKIFQICKCFRKGERGERHLPEFTMLEWYRAHADYHGLMADCEDLFLFLANARPGPPIQETGSGPAMLVNGHTVSLAKPWERLTVAEAFQRYTDLTPEKALADDRFDEIICRDIEPNLGINRPCLLYDYPAQLGALARLKGDNPAVAERFELYINGLELANGFSELTDPVEQRRRFAEDREVIKKLGRTPGPMPEKFLAELTRLPEAAGIALGLDRLAMLFLEATAIDEAVTFSPEDL